MGSNLAKMTLKRNTFMAFPEMYEQAELHCFRAKMIKLAARFQTPTCALGAAAPTREVKMKPRKYLYPNWIIPSRLGKRKSAPTSRDIDMCGTANHTERAAVVDTESGERPTKKVRYLGQKTVHHIVVLPGDDVEMTESESETFESMDALFIKYEKSGLRRRRIRKDQRTIREYDAHVATRFHWYTVSEVVRMVINEGKASFMIQDVDIEEEQSAQPHTSTPQQATAPEVTMSCEPSTPPQAPAPEITMSSEPVMPPQASAPEITMSCEPATPPPQALAPEVTMSCEPAIPSHALAPEVTMSCSPPRAPRPPKAFAPEVTMACPSTPLQSPAMEVTMVYRPRTPSITAPMAAGLTGSSPATPSSITSTPISCTYSTPATSVSSSPAITPYTLASSSPVITPDTSVSSSMLPAPTTPMPPPQTPRSHKVGDMGPPKMPASRSPSRSPVLTTKDASPSKLLSPAKINTADSNVAYTPTRQQHGGKQKESQPKRHEQKPQKAAHNAGIKKAAPKNKKSTFMDKLEAFVQDSGKLGMLTAEASSDALPSNNINNNLPIVPPTPSSNHTQVTPAPITPETASTGATDDWGLGDLTKQITKVEQSNFGFVVDTVGEDPEVLKAQYKAESSSDEDTEPKKMAAGGRSGDDGDESDDEDEAPGQYAKKIEAAEEVEEKADDEDRDEGNARLGDDKWALLDDEEGGEDWRKVEDGDLTINT